MDQKLERQRPKYRRDRELRGLLEQGAQSLGDMRLNRFLRAHERFNRPVMVHEENGNVREEKFWDLKQVLAEVPEYIEASDHAGLAPDQAEELLLGLLNSTPFDFERNHLNIRLLRGALNQQAESDPLGKRDISQIQKMIEMAGKYGVLPASLFGYTTARRIGLNVKDSTSMIMHLPDADGSLAGYTFGAFNEALSTLAIAEVDPKLVVKTFGKLGGKRPYYRQGAYRVFEEVVTFGCPSKRISPQELMQSYFIHGKGQDISEFLAKMMGSDVSNALEGDSPKIEIFSGNEERDKYFIAKPGNLEHAALPYRTQRGFAEGLQDLEQLAQANMHMWEKTAEGYWVFDPNSDIWYSLGGKTDVDTGRVRHNFINYDISQLSQNPYLIHLHPRDFEIFLTNPHQDFPNRRYRDHVTKFLAATPSRADYDTVARQVESVSSRVSPRSFIVHGLGTTEFTYPDDLNALKRMSQESRDIRDLALTSFPWNQIMDLRNEEGHEVVVRHEAIVKLLMRDLNQLLPDNFSLNLFPTGSRIEV